MLLLPQFMLEKISRFSHRYFEDNIIGIHYAVRIFIGTTVLWLLLQYTHITNPIWAIISLIVVIEPQIQPAWIAFRARIVNTLIGSAIGLVSLAVTGPESWILTPSLTVAAIISSHVNKGKAGWRIAPVTTALVIAAAMTQHSTMGALEIALQRTMEVCLGSAMALMVTLGMVHVWLPPEVEQADKDKTSV